jgi:hypothetical protein
MTGDWAVEFRLMVAGLLTRVRGYRLSIKERMKGKVQGSECLRPGRAARVSGGAVVLHIAGLSYAWEYRDQHIPLSKVIAAQTPGCLAQVERPRGPSNDLLDNSVSRMTG